MSLRSLYRLAVPEPIRRAVRKLIPGGKGPYARSYYAMLDRFQQEAYPVMARSLVRRFAPTGVIDVGCGSGGLLAELRKVGVDRLLGLDVNPGSIESCRRRGLEVRRIDLAERHRIDFAGELAVCLEVAEHLPEQAAGPLVATLTSGPGRLVFSAATPGQGGEDHCNEQPHEYWIGRFAAAGWRLDAAATEGLRRDWQAPGVPRWYGENVMVFVRSRRGEDAGAGG